MKENNGARSKKALKVNFVKFFCIVLPLAGVLTLVFWNFYLLGVQAKYSIVEEEESRTVGIANKLFVQDFANVESDLFVLADILNSKKGDLSDGDMERFGNEFLYFSKRKNMYDQIRLIDAFGMEIIRVNFDQGKPIIVSKGSLQDKSKRYYFKQSINLRSEEVYMSRLDLNIENGVIERPGKILPGDFIFNRVWRLHKDGEYVKPMIRFATPVFDLGNKKRGVLVLNYFGEHLLKIFEDITSSSYGKSALVDQKGYWLKGLDRESEWGFIKELSGAKNARLQDKYSQVWEIMSKKEAGQFYTDDGLFTFNTVYPLTRKYFLSLNSDVYVENIKGETSDYLWKAFTFVSNEKMQEIISDVRKKSLFVYMILLSVLFIATFVFVQIDEKRKLFEQGEKELFVALANEKKREAQELALLNEQLMKNEQDLKNANFELRQREGQLKNAYNELQESKFEHADIIEKLKKANNSMKGRELRIIEIKKKVKYLEEKLKERER